MLSPGLETFRLFIHVLAASVWVGGQVVLAGIVPAVRRSHPEATRVVAVAYSRIAWPAFVVAVLSGVWNLTAIPLADTGTAYQITLFVKVTLAVTSGAAAAVHQLGRSTAAVAIGGAVGFSTALAAMYVGYLLTTGR